MPNDLGTCDHCLERIGKRGWMIDSGEKLRLDEDGPELPVYRFYCSETCCRADQEADDAT